MCSKCLETDRAVREASWFNAADKVPYLDYDLPYLYWAGAPHSFFPTRLELENYCVDNNIPPPQWVWAVQPIGWLLDAEAILRNAGEVLGVGVGIRDMLDDVEVEELQEKLDDWALQREIKTYEPDYSLAVILDQTLFDRLMTDASVDPPEHEEEEEEDEGDAESS